LAMGWLFVVLWFGAIFLFGLLVRAAAQRPGQPEAGSAYLILGVFALAGLLPLVFPSGGHATGPVTLAPGSRVARRRGRPAAGWTERSRSRRAWTHERACTRHSPAGCARSAPVFQTT
jgi:hypothetical protein